MSTAFVFPGQGSHRAGALGSWTDHPAAAVLDDVSDGVGRDVVSLSEDETAGGRTADAQPAILAASLVPWRALVDAGVRADVVAGHSLGEYTAAIAAGAVGVRDGAALVAERGAAMGEACARNPGTLTAVVKLDPDAVDALLADLDEVVLANDNAPGQVVLGGPHEAIAEVRDRARAAGGRALPLDVEGAFHTPAMAPAVPRIEAALDAVTLRDADVPLVAGATARESRDAAVIAEGLASGVLSPVRWREVQLRLADLGVTTLVEVGPGGVLGGLARRTVPHLTVHTVASPDDLDAVVEALVGESSG